MAITEILSAHAQYVELYINQQAYSIRQDSFPFGLPGKRGESGSLLGFERLKCLWQSVENIRAWLDDFHQISPSKLVGQPFHFWSQMILSITLLKYLSTLKDPEWDFQAVRTTVPLIPTLDSMLQNLELSAKDPRLQCDDHLINFLAKLLTKCRLWAEARWMTPQVPGVDPSSCQGVGDTPLNHNEQLPDLNRIFWMQSMNLGDEQWFQDVLGLPIA